MQRYKTTLFGLLILTLTLSSCLKSGLSQQYSNAYGVVNQNGGITYVKTTSGDSITWKDINLAPGSCLKFTAYAVDYNSSGAILNANNVSYKILPEYSLVTGEPAAVDSYNTINSLTTIVGSASNWFSDNWFLKLATVNYPNVTVIPQFYFADSIKANFDVTKDSVIVNVRLKANGTPDLTETAIRDTTEIAVNLSKIRSLATGYSLFHLGTVPIYFRYFTSATATTAMSLKVAMSSAE